MSDSNVIKLTQPCQPSPEGVAGSACTSTFSRLARRSIALPPAHARGHQFVTRYPKASDISSPPCLLRLLPAGANRRVGLAPTGKRRLVTAHPLSGHCRMAREAARTGRRRRFPVGWPHLLQAGTACGRRGYIDPLQHAGATDGLRRSPSIGVRCEKTHRIRCGPTKNPINSVGPSRRVDE